ncbi:MAG: hypothetical protein IKT14_00715 [Clostridiales bacterium]|nr:hypothetical protein [Clostridiales bacterium]
MKKSGNKDTKDKKSLFGNKKDEIMPEFALKDRGVRNIGDAARFLEDRNNYSKDFGEPEDIQEKWGLGVKDIAAGNRKRKTIIRGLTAFLITVAMVVGVFYALPRILPGFFKGSNIELFVEKDVNYDYDDSYRVVKDTAVSVMSDPDPASDYITQVLYNEPVRYGGEEGDYTLITTMDGITGYVKSASLTKDTSSVEPDLHEYKLSVSDTSKNIMTHASQGTLITRVAMNTVLYADVKRDGVYQVALPGGDMGWIGSSGVIEIGPREEIEEVSTRYFVSSALSFVNSSYLPGGITMNGMSIEGLVYVCSSVNGIKMPRTAGEQMEMGEEVELQYDVVTGDLMIDSIIPGDILFLRSPYSDSYTDIYEMAICTDTGTLLMVSGSGTTIRLTSFDAGSELCGRIICVRRYFSQ